VRFAWTFGFQVLLLRDIALMTHRVLRVLLSSDVRGSSSGRRYVVPRDNAGQVPVSIEVVQGIYDTYREPNQSICIPSYRPIFHDESAMYIRVKEKDGEQSGNSHDSQDRSDNDPGRKVGQC